MRVEIGGAHFGEWLQYLPRRNNAGHFHLTEVRMPPFKWQKDCFTIPGIGSYLALNTYLETKHFQPISTVCLKLESRYYIYQQGGSFSSLPLCVFLWFFTTRVKHSLKNLKGIRVHSLLHNAIGAGDAT